MAEAVNILRDALFGNPPRARAEPSREGVLAAFSALEGSLSLLLAALVADESIVVYAQRSSLYANLSPADRSLGIVYNDGANSGVYIKSGAAGTGAWVATGLMLRGETGGPGVAGESIYDLAIASGAVPPGTTPDQFVQRFIGQLVGDATNTLNAQVASAQQSADLAQDAAGIDRTYATKATATGYANGELVQIVRDETQGNARTLYRAENGGLTFLAKVAAVNTDLSNVADGAITPGAVSIAGLVPVSPYYGGAPHALGVGGLLVAGKFTNGGEHRLINTWNGNNTFSIQNLSNDDAYSCMRCLDHTGRETCAFGWGNVGTVLDVPYAGATYWESSVVINADGSQSSDKTLGVHPMRVIQSGFQTRRGQNMAESGSWTRTEISLNGDWNFQTLSPVLSGQKHLISFSAGNGFYSAIFRDADTLAPVFRVRSINGYEKSGIVIGSTYEGGAFPPPQVAVDAVGTVLAGKDVSTARPTSIDQAGVQFPFVAIDGDVASFRHVRPGVGKYDIMFYDAGSGKPLRYALIDRDHSDAELFWAALDGTKKVGIGGNVGFNGVAPIAPPALPAALPTDGSATPAQLAAAYNAIRASLIAYGLNTAA